LLCISFRIRGTTQKESNSNIFLYFHKINQWLNEQLGHFSKTLTVVGCFYITLPQKRVTSSIYTTGT